MLGKGSKNTLHIGFLRTLVIVWVFAIFALLVRKISVKLLVLWRKATTTRRREVPFALF